MVYRGPMKLLIITQKIDTEDPVLGFFHRWAEKLAAAFEDIHIICLQKGSVSLPRNITVWSLGKETKPSQIRYSAAFYKYIWSLRDRYDAVFVHMNPVYIVLGCLLWRMLRKPVFLWYNHAYGGFMAWAAAKAARSVFYTSPFSFTARFKHSQRMPAGIDTGLFRRDDRIRKEHRTLLYLGRVSPVKKVDVLVKAAGIAHQKGLAVFLNIVGGAETSHAAYFKQVKKLAEELLPPDTTAFPGAVPNYKTAEIYNRNEVCINLSPSGLFDKTILEAMACEMLVLVSSDAFREILPDVCLFAEDNAEDLAGKIMHLLQLPEEAKRAYGRTFRDYVATNHSLDRLIQELSARLGGQQPFTS